eukprot:CAMPEP_0177642524 /NCGR_PEP_ID=MMETSP0447-20121125/7632_1 /TAXON_ID=0 /ORGANISM="Stygamoeba regulata, Strain BSH-02190019" /LENGTH=1284 /DNA_ID=CAMNT_0019144687 /DNA_START=56 /DNA_END=3910 /DNA_ORIENTATION=-
MEIAGLEELTHYMKCGFDSSHVSEVTLSIDCSDGKSLTVSFSESTSSVQKMLSGLCHQLRTAAEGRPAERERTGSWMPASRPKIGDPDARARTVTTPSMPMSAAEKKSSVGPGEASFDSESPSQVPRHPVIPLANITGSKAASTSQLDLPHITEDKKKKSAPSQGTEAVPFPGIRFHHDSAAEAAAEAKTARAERDKDKRLEGDDKLLRRKSRFDGESPVGPVSSCSMGLQEKKRADASVTIIEPMLPIFGVNLPKLMERQRKSAPDNIHTFVPFKRAVDKIISHGLRSPLLFQQTKSQLEEFRQLKSSNTAIAGDMSVPDDPFVLSGFILLFLSELPQSLIPSSQLDSLITAGTSKDFITVYPILKSVVAQCPQPNREMLRYLMLLLHMVDVNAEVTSCNINDVGDAFSAVLVRRTNQRQSAVALALDEMKRLNTAVRHYITHYEDIFKDYHADYFEAPHTLRLYSSFLDLLRSPDGWLLDKLMKLSDAREAPSLASALIELFVHDMPTLVALLCNLVRRQIQRPGAKLEAVFHPESLVTHLVSRFFSCIGTSFLRYLFTPIITSVVFDSPDLAHNEEQLIDFSTRFLVKILQSLDGIPVAIRYVAATIVDASEGVGFGIPFSILQHIFFNRFVCPVITDPSIADIMEGRAVPRSLQTGLAYIAKLFTFFEVYEVHSDMMDAETPDHRSSSRAAKTPSVAITITPAKKEFIRTGQSAVRNFLNNLSTIPVDMYGNPKPLSAVAGRTQATTASQDDRQAIITLLLWLKSNVSRIEAEEWYQVQVRKPVPNNSNFDEEEYKRRAIEKYEAEQRANAELLRQRRIKEVAVPSSGSGGGPGGAWTTTTPSQAQSSPLNSPVSKDPATPGRKRSVSESGGEFQTVHEEKGMTGSMLQLKSVLTALDYFIRFLLEPSIKMKLVRHTSAVTGLALSRRGKVWSADKTGRLCCWNVADSCCEQTINTEVVGICAIWVDRTNVWLASEEFLQVWSSKTGQFVKQLANSGVHALASSSSKVWASSKNFIYVYDVASLNCDKALYTQGKTFKCLTDVNNMFVWGGSDEGSLVSWETITTEEVSSIPDAHSATVTSVIQSGVHIWSASADGEIAVWDHEMCALIRRFPGHTESISHLLNAHSQVWSCGDFGTIKIWSTKAADTLAVLPTLHTGCVTNALLVWNYDKGQWEVWTSSVDGSVCAWQVLSCEQLPPPQDPQGDEEGVPPVPRGRSLSFGSAGMVGAGGMKPGMPAAGHFKLGAEIRPLPPSHQRQRGQTENFRRIKSMEGTEDSPVTQ